MSHYHGRSHLVRRHNVGFDHRQQQDEWKPLVRKGRNDDPDNGVATVISVVVKTMPKTFSGDAVWVTQAPATLIAPAMRVSSTSQPSSKAKSSSSSNKPTP